MTVVHVTHFNALMWDSGHAEVRVIEHGIVDPGERYTGELPRAAAVINEIERMHAELAADAHPLVGPATWSVGQIHGGTGVSTVPGECVSRRTAGSCRASGRRTCSRTNLG